MAHDPTTWPQALAVCAGVIFGLVGISFIVPIPWMMLAAYLEGREQRKSMLAKARLKEAEAALIQAKGGRP